MKRYRYTASQRTGWKRYLPLMYAFTAWNFFGYIAWHKMMKKTKEEHPEYDSLSHTQKALLVYGYADSNAKTTKITLGRGMKVEEMTGKDLFDKYSKKGEQEEKSVENVIEADE
ncbi:uncharacterized protein LOC143068161 [Mytilus galloprovincialis]|uniref:uncharacterized protein LOC143068161 n=1 Tax=Mytilus galloprovincialis TaxID=29158 RepID=UPI003F7CA8BA